MTMSFALILVLLAAATGLIWLLDALLFARRRRREAAPGEAPRVPVLVDYARSFFPVILVVLLFRSFIAEPFRIPSGSMMPTLDVGDFILVNKFSYGLRWPVLDRKFLALGEPERGDVVVFRYPGDPAQNWIKRVIGLPGDEVTIRGHQLMVNGEVVPRNATRPYADNGSREAPQMVQLRAELSEEDLFGIEHEVLTVPGARRSPQGTWTVPAGQYFVMGDNRDNSMDSRYWGFLPEENLVGKAFLIWLSWRGMDHGFIEFSRIGTVVE